LHIKHRLIVSRFLVGLLALGGGIAALPVAASYAEHAQAAALIEELVSETDVPREALERALAAATRQDSILEAIARPAERVRPWHEYRAIFITPQRISEGETFAAEHAELLARAEQQYGVPAAVILAILGVETYYGRITGKHRVVDALATLAFDYPPRASFFRSELKHFLVLTHQQAMDPLTLHGSYAGAMGYGQFMPSSYRAYAVDFDGDGRIDIWNSPADAIGSVANYLRRHGWRTGEPVVSRATTTGDVAADWFGRGLKPERTVAELRAGGILPLEPLHSDAKALPLRLEAETGYEHWIGLHNFYVITRYNHSAMYALAVWQLAQQLAGDPA